MRIRAGLPTLWRGDGAVQVGADPRLALVLEGLGAEELRFLDALHSEVPASRSPRRDDVEQLAHRHGVDGGRAHAIVAHLRSHGALVEGAEPYVPATNLDLLHLAGLGAPEARVLARRAEGAVVIMGGGAPGLQIATLLADAGVGTVAVLDDEAVTTADVGRSGYDARDVGMPRSVAATAHLRGVRADVDVGLPATPDVVVLVEPHVSVPFRASGLVRQDVTHLSVVPRDLDVVVGPTVVPGRTACLRCLDLTRCEEDPSWPAIATQLTLVPAPTHAAGTLAVASGLAAQEVLAVLDGREPALTGRVVAVGIEAWPTTRRLAPHPGCGCGAVG